MVNSPQTPSRGTDGASATPGSARKRNQRLQDLNSQSSPLSFPGSSPLTFPSSDLGASSHLSSDIGTPLAYGSQTPSSPAFPMRNDLNHANRITAVHTPARELSSNLRSTSDIGAAAGPQDLIWGTNINVNNTMERFRDFVEGFRQEEGTSYYLRALHYVKLTEIYSLNIDASHIHSYDDELYNQVVRFPQEVIPIFDLVIHDIFTHTYPEVELPTRIQVRLFNLKEKKKMRDLDPDDIDHIVSIKGMIIRVSNIIPDLKQGFFKCSNCHKTEEVAIDRGRIEEPVRCDNCQLRGSFTLVHNLSVFANSQFIKLQETPDSIPEGETPQTVTLNVFDELVDTVKPGDNVEVTGIYRAAPVRPNPRFRRVTAIYRTFMDVVHFHKHDKKRMQAEAVPEEQGIIEGTGVEENQEAIEAKVTALAQQPNIYDKLTHALAPNIWELDDVKRGLLCMLFGGSNKSFAASGRGRFRGEINVLLCGDPGTSKSQLLGYVHKIAPRGVYTSGKGSSAVGLTAYVTKDPDTRDIVLESGALVLSDRGICCIDEFDKMSDTTRAVLHEVMEQQTISIAKAGIICSLNARTSILASANPKESRYDPYLSIVENLQLPPTLLSRFDLIYLMLDKPERSTDSALAAHLVSMYNTNYNAEAAEIDQTTLMQYISYAREHVNPTITDEAMDVLINGYVDLRRLGGASSKVVTATPRQLESLIRLSEALARIHLSSEVLKVHVDEAIRLMRQAMQTSATDPLTGQIDMDQITTGLSLASRTRIDQLAAAVKERLRAEFAEGIKADVLLAEMNKESSLVIRERDLKQALDVLRREDAIHTTSAGLIKPSR